MSLIEIILSRKEVVISLIFVALIMLAAVAVVVGPAVSRRRKKLAAQRKARQAARALEARRKAKNQRRRRNAESDSSESPVVGEPAVALKAAQEIPALPQTLPEQPETPPAEEETATDIQDLLASVFIDDAANTRHEVLMRGVIVPSAEELLAFSRKIADDLRAKNGSPV